MQKNLFSAVCEAFSLVQVKVSFVFILFDDTDFPCLFSTLVNLCVKKHHCLSLSEGELLQWNTLIKMKILMMTLFWQFEACVLCQFFLKSLYIFKISQGRKWNFNSERVWLHVICTNCGKWKQVIHYWQLGKNKPWQKKPTDST